MKHWIITNKFYLLGTLVGGLAGFLYWQQVGCLTGTCAITAKPVNSTIYGALLGALIPGIFKNGNKAKINNE